MDLINSRLLRVCALTVLLGGSIVACQRNPQNVQAAREENATNADQSNNASTNANQDKLMSQADRAFMQRAEDADIKERDLGRVMAQKSQNSDVRDYAKMLADDHDKDLKNVMNILQNKGIRQPKNMVQVNNQALTELNNLNGSALDRRFIDMMVMDHQRDVAEYSKETKSGEDPAVRDYAARTLTTLQDHLKKAQELQGKLQTASTK